MENLTFYSLAFIGFGLLMLEVDGGGPSPAAEFRTIVKCQTIIQPVIRPTPTCNCKTTGKKIRTDNPHEKIAPKKKTKAVLTDEKKDDSAKTEESSGKKGNSNGSGMKTSSLAILIGVVILAVLFCIGIVCCLFYLVKKRTGLWCPYRKGYERSTTNEKRIVIT